MRGTEHAWRNKLGIVLFRNSEGKAQLEDPGN